MKKYALIIISILAGTLGGITFIIFSLILNASYGSPLYPPAPKYNDFFIYVIILALTFFVYKRYFNQKMSFWQGLALGSITGILTLIISLVFLQIFLSQIAPEIFENYKNLLYQEMKTDNPEVMERYGGKENYEKILNDLKNTTLAQLLWLETRQKLALTLFITLITAAFLRFRKVIIPQNESQKKKK